MPAANGDVGCACATDGDCDDGDACTDASCASGLCTAEPNGATNCPCSADGDCVPDPGGKRAECLSPFINVCVTVYCECHCACSGWTTDTMCLSSPCDSCAVTCTEECAPGGGTYSGDCS